MTDQISNSEFHAPSSFTFIDQMVIERDGLKDSIEKIAGVMAGNPGAVRFFLDAQSRENRRSFTVRDDKTFLDSSFAIRELDRTFWRDAITRIGVMELLPAKRFQELQDQLEGEAIEGVVDDDGKQRYHELPEFTTTHVTEVLKGLLLERGRFFGEMVEGAFKALSPEHITNAPNGFGRRMIMYCDTETTVCRNGHAAECLHDLRRIIAVLLNRETPDRHTTYRMVENFDRDGQWRWYDGHAFRARGYKKGTVHVEISSQIAWRLNEVLAERYPAAIPPEFRRVTKTPKTEPVISPFNEILSDSVVNAFEQMRIDGNDVQVNLWSADKHVAARVRAIMELLGGVFSQNRSTCTFPYPFKAIRAEIMRTHCCPDVKSHQYYPTRDTVARAAVEWANIEPHHSVLEPSAGTGGIAKLLDRDRLTCVEYSPMFCVALNAMGFNTINADFLKTDLKAARVVMNPPFDRGQWKRHVNHAVKCLNPEGVLVAVVPDSVQVSSFDVGPNARVELGEKFEGEFKNTRIVVRLVRIIKV